MMDRKAFLGTLAGGLLAAPLAVEAQQVGKVARVGSLTTPQRHLDAFQKGLREAGLVEGVEAISEGCL